MFVYSQFEENRHRRRQNRDIILSKETDILQLMEMRTCCINRVRFMQGFFKEQACNFCMSHVWAPAVEAGVFGSEKVQSSHQIWTFRN